jgi:hypothetical protein
MENFGQWSDGSNNVGVKYAARKIMSVNINLFILSTAIGYSTAEWLRSSSYSRYSYESSWTGRAMVGVSSPVCESPGGKGFHRISS